MTTLAELGEVSKSLIRTPGGGAAYRPLTRLNPATGKHESAGISRAVRRTVTRDQRVRAAGGVPQAPGGRGAEAKAQYLADRAQAKANRVGHFRATGSPQHGSQAEEMGRIQTRRRYAESDAQRGENLAARRTRRKEESYVKERNKEYNDVKMSTFQRRWLGGSAAVAVPGAGVAYHQAHKQPQKVGKALDKDEAIAATGGGVAGLAGSNLAYTAGGYAAKKHIARRRRDFLINNPEQREPQKKAWKAHLKSHGYARMSDVPMNQRVKVKWTTPKNIHDWKLDRALAFKNKAATEIGVKGAAGVGGAYLAARAVRNRRNKEKA